MTPILIGGAAVLAVILFSHASALPLMASTPRAAPGPQSQQAGKTAPPVPASPPPPVQQSPNATLQTVQQGMVIVNNGLGLLDKINQLYTDSSPADSEYPIAAQPGTDDLPMQTPPSIMSANFDTTEYALDNNPFDSFYTS